MEFYTFQAEEAEKSIDIDGFELNEGKLFVIWKWTWCDSFAGSCSRESDPGDSLAASDDETVMIPLNEEEPYEDEQLLRTHSFLSVLV